MCHWLLLLGSIGYTGDSGMVAMGPMVIAVLCALVVGAAVTRIVLSVTRRFDWLDRPNVRSAHKRPTPTAGGIGIIAGFWAGGAVAVWEGVWSGVEWWGLLGATALLLLAVIDDVVRPMRPGEKTILLLLAVAVWLGWGPHFEWLVLPGVGEVSLWWWGWPLTVLWFVFLCNAFNFMDGIDGLSALQTICACCWMGLIFGAIGSPVAAMTWILAGAVGGFLVFNVPPARIFMGDVGSLFIGFTIAAFGVLGARAGLPLWVFSSVLAFYFFDVCYTLTRRLLRGENVIEAHRKHLYQRLGRLGWSHGRINAVTCCITSIFGLGAYRHMEDEAGLLFFLLGGGLLIAGVVWIEMRDPEFA